MEHNRNRRQVTLQREEVGIARRARSEKGHKKARKRALLGPRWFRENHRKCFRMNGGDDGTRTRGLCRDSAGRCNLLELNGTDSPF